MGSLSRVLLLYEEIFIAENVAVYLIFLFSYFVLFVFILLFLRVFFFGLRSVHRLND